MFSLSLSGSCRIYSVDRDSGHWIRDDPDEIERRRKLFWEVYAYGVCLCVVAHDVTVLKPLLDAWIVSIGAFALGHILIQGSQSFIMGRPPSFNLAHIQCHLPKDTQQLINDKGQAEPSCALFEVIFRKANP